MAGTDSSQILYSLMKLTHLLAGILESLPVEGATPKAIGSCVVVHAASTDEVMASLQKDPLSKEVWDYEKVSFRIVSKRKVVLNSHIRFRFIRYQFALTWTTQCSRADTD